MFLAAAVIAIGTCSLSVLWRSYLPRYTRQQNVKVLLHAALNAVKIGNYEQAEQLYRELLRLDNSNARGLRGLGSIMALQGDYMAAVEYYREAAANGDVESLRMLAGIHVLAGRPDLIRALVPSLLAHRSDDQEFVISLLYYAIEFRDRDVYERAVYDIDEGWLHERQDAREMLSIAKAVFSDNPEGGGVVESRKYQGDEE